MLCKNCRKPVMGNYCSNCGEKVSHERITFSYFAEELFHFFTHLNKGFWFTTASMVKNPGNTVLTFVDGKRKAYQAPISYFLLWITFYGLLLYWLQHIFGENVVIDYKEYFGPGATTTYAITHLAAVLAIVVPFQSLYLYLFVTRKKYYYMETVVMVVYCLGTIIFFQFIFALLSLFIYGVWKTSVQMQVSDGFKIIYLVWFTVSLVRFMPGIKYRVVRGILFAVLSFGTFSLWRLYGYPYLSELLSH